MRHLPGTGSGSPFNQHIAVRMLVRSAHKGVSRFVRIYVHFWARPCHCGCRKPGSGQMRGEFPGNARAMTFAPGEWAAFTAGVRDGSSTFPDPRKSCAGWPVAACRKQRRTAQPTPMT